MAGIFDFLASDENRMALGLLAQGGDFGRALAGAVQYADQGKASKRKQAHEDLQNQLLQTQMANYQSEIRNRDLAAVRDARRQSWLTDDEPAGAPGGGGPATAGQAGTPGASGGMPPGGGAGAPAGRGGLMGLARELGVDPRLIRTDMALTDGKGITEMLAKRAAPNWVNINGNLVNTNAPGFQGGIQDQVQMGADGRAMLLRGNGGNPVMGAVPGSFDTYSAFKDIDNRTSARYSPGRPVIGADGRQYGQSQLDEIGGGAPRAPAMAPPGMGGRPGPTNAAEQGMAAQVATVPYDVQREIAAVQRELPSITNPKDRAEAMAYLQRLQSQGGAQTPAAASSPAGALEFSPAEKAAQAAAEARLVGQAKADIAPADQRASGISQSREMLNGIDMLRNHPGRETGTGLSSYADPRNFIPGTDAKDFQVALDQVKGKTFLQAFESLKGAGQITEVEGKKATEAIARLNTAQSDKSFSGALDDLERVVRGSMSRQEGSASRSGVQAGQSARDGESKPAQNLLASLPPANGANKGKRARDTETGKVYVSNGLQWKEE